MIGKQPYPLSLGPYEFLWFELQPTLEQAEIQAEEPSWAFATVSVAAGWESVFEGAQWNILERALPDYLQKQRWFGGKSRRIAQTSLVDWAELDRHPLSSRSGGGDLRRRAVRISTCSCLAASFGSAAGAIRSSTAAAILCPAVSAEGDGVLHDAILNDETCLALLDAIGEAREIRTTKGVIRGVPAQRFRGTSRLTGRDAHSAPQLRRAEQLIHPFRRPADLEVVPAPGSKAPIPDCEIGQYLTEKTTFNRIPPFAGLIEYVRSGAEPTTLAMLQGLVANEGDGWKWNQEELARYYEEHARLPLDGDFKMPDGSWFELSESEPTRTRPRTPGHLPGFRRHPGPTHRRDALGPGDAHR